MLCRVGRWARVGVAVLAVGACVGSNVAQDGHGPDEGSPQKLTIWIVRPVTAADRAVQRAQAELKESTVYRESTVGDFGKSASEVGQTAGSYGKPASEVGKNASDVGQTAGSYGQTSSSLPSNVKSQTAGSYGTTAGSFGVPASEYTGAPKVTQDDLPISRESKGGAWTEFLHELPSTIAQMQVRVIEVNGTALRERLAAAAHTGAYPDVLISDRMPDWWAEGSGGLVVVRLAHAGRMLVFPNEQPTAAPRQANPYAAAFGMAQAPHPAAARMFLEWWYRRVRFSDAVGPAPEQPPAAEVVARAAVGAVLAGGSLDGVADEAMARFNPVIARAQALGIPPERVPADLHAETAVTSFRANSRLAVVLLHSVCLSRAAYGELFPVVVLRADARGQWKVLQLSLSMNAKDAVAAFGLLETYAGPAKAPVTVVAPVPASPPNGDQQTVGQGLRVSWDNKGDDGLLLMEWQLGREGRAPASSVVLVDDADGRQQNDVPAPFADAAGPVRWRVWALGRGGAVRISDWRTVSLEP